MVKYLAPGYAIAHIADGDIPAGKIVTIGDYLPTVAKMKIANLFTGALHTSGVYDVVKLDDAFEIGDFVWWTGSAAATWGAPLGVCVKEAASGDARVRVRLATFAQAVAAGVVEEGSSSSAGG